MENYRDSIALSLEIKNLLLQLTDVYKVSASPYLEKVEDLAKQAVNRKKDYLAIVLELFRFEEKNELIEVILMNFVLKLMREFFDQIPSDNTSINELINSAVSIVRDSYSDPFFTSKMLEFLRQYFGLPLAYITLDNTRKIWKIVKSFLRIQEDFMAQMSHDMAIKSIKAFFGTLKQKGQELLSTETQEITLFILGELTKEIAELITSLKKETQAASRKQQLKSLENLCSCLLFCLELLVDHDLTFLNDFLLEDILYFIMQLGEIEDSNILSLNLSFHLLFWKLKNNSFLDVRSLISTIFNQTIMRPLQRFSTKFLSGQIKERDIFNLHHLISYLIQFLQNKEYVNFVYAHNDLTSLKKPLYDQILVNVFKIAKKAAENTTLSYSREIFDIILEFLYGSLEIDESSTLHLENISQEDKEKFAKLLSDTQKWERDAALISEDPKKFLKRMDEYYSQESLEDKAEKIAYFLHLSHHVPSGKIIEILGLDKPLNREILKKYLVALDFTGLDIIKAMRLFFVNFLMFGEAQVVERVLAAFCGHYYACNSESFFKSSGPVHTFTYAIIMLNTDLYKPILKEKMSIEAFVNNCRDINDGEDLPEEFLRSCYNSLKQYEIKTLASRDLSQEENVTQETWKNYLKTIQMYDSESARIYAKNDNFVDPKEIKDLELLIDYHCHKKVILKIIDNLDLFLAKGYQDPSSIDLLLDKIVKVCVHYEMLENLDNIMISMDKKLESNPNFDLMKMNEQSLWNLFCAFLFMKKALIYLQGSINIVAKLLVKTFNLRKYIADDKIAQKYLKRYRKIKQSSKFSSKAIYKNSSFFEAFLGFVSKEEASSEEEDDAKVLQRVEYQSRGTMDKLTLHKKYYNEYNIFEEIYDQTKFLPDQHIVKFFNVLISDPEILEATQKDPNLLISLNANLFEVAARNYDRPHIFWSALASGFIQLSLVESKGKQTDQAQKDKLNQLFKLDDNKLGALFEPLFQKKTRKLTTMKLFIHYSLLELCLEFCHNTKDLVGFEEVLNYLLECLTEYSIPILFEFIKMIQEVVNSYQFTESQNLTNWVYLLRIMRKMLEAIEKNSTGVVEVKDICLQYAEVLNDIVLKLSFLTDNDFTETLRELTALLVRFHNSEVAKQFQLISKVINNFYLLIVGIEKKKANDYLKATPELIYSVYDLAHKFVLENNSVEIGLALKLFQKVLYVLNLDTSTTDEQLNNVLTKLNEIKKKLVTQNDENLCLGYVEMLRKFLLSHIEKVQPSGQLQMMLSFYEQSYEIYKMSVDKKYETLMETLLEYLNNTTNVLVGLNILGSQGEGNGNLYQAIYDIIDKFPKQKIEEKVEEKVEAKPETNIEEKIEQKAEEKIEQKTEEKPEEKVEEKAEPKAEEKVEEKTEPNGATQEEVPPKESS